MWKFLPWHFIVRRAAKRFGVIDPVTWMARVRAFSQPSEVQEPIELLRAGIVFHARGLVNVKAIQHNLDWIWPFWVERQFKPGDPSFIPRAFSFSHINLTHRNWTAAGLPDVPIYPIVDPRGLVTPLHDGWSVDFWIIPKSGGDRLFPSKTDSAACRQSYEFDHDELAVATRIEGHGAVLDSRVEMKSARSLEIRIDAECRDDAWLIAAIRPYNPEGIQFIDHLKVSPDRRAILVNKTTAVSFSEVPAGIRMARYEEGDVYHRLDSDTISEEIACDAGMATAACLFDLPANLRKSLTITVPLDEEISVRVLDPAPVHTLGWAAALAPLAKLEVADERTRFLYDAAIRTMLMLSAGELVPGPNTYRRFWFRDACLMMAPLLAIGLVDRCGSLLETFPRRQTGQGYFLSQEGEWDSNGQVLWIAARHAAITGTRLGSDLEDALDRAMEWLDRKRLSPNPERGPAGLLPAGFSAEHLGPNDFYYWDDFWAAGGLRDIARYWETHRQHERAARAAKLHAGYIAAIENSIRAIAPHRSRGGIPAAPGRRMDSGAIGSMVADYPLKLYPPGDKRIMATMEHLMEKSFHQGGFFQQMIHSGINAYLTLDLAQTLLRAGDPRFADLIRATAALASPTGQWPEAIHPNTLGGCMGDGQHGWAAAEWIMMMRKCFVREEGGGLIVGSGILPEWMSDGHPASFGPTLTPFGPLTVTVRANRMRIDADWRGTPPEITVAVPGFHTIPGARAGETLELIPLS